MCDIRRILIYVFLDFFFSKSPFPILMKLVKSQRPEGIRRDRGRRRLGNEFLAESDPDGIA